MVDRFQTGLDPAATLLHHRRTSVAITLYSPYSPRFASQRRGADRCRPQRVTLPSGIVSPKFSFYCLTSRAHGGRLEGHQVGRIIEGRPPAFLPRVTSCPFPEGRTFFDRGPLRCPRRFYCFSILAATIQRSCGS